MRTTAKEYYRNAAGIIVPSVTTVLDELNKPALVRWANKLGLQGIDSNKYKDELADIGTLSHYFISCRLQEDIPDVSNYSPVQVDSAQLCFAKYLDWEAKNNIRSLLVEERLISEQYQYGGTPDLYALCDSGFLLGDFKTNSKGIYFEMVVQVAAYWHLLLENGYRLTKAVILRIGRDDKEGFDEKILTTTEIEVGWQVFVRALDIYNLKKGEEPICTELIIR